MPCAVGIRQAGGALTLSSGVLSLEERDVLEDLRVHLHRVLVLD
jgi:hypothetical protein